MMWKIHRHTKMSITTVNIFIESPQYYYGHDCSVFYTNKFAIVLTFYDKGTTLAFVLLCQAPIICLKSRWK